MEPRGVARVPRAQRGGGLVRKQHIVLGVVEYGLGVVLLLARCAGTGVRDQAAARAQLPQFDQRVAAGRQQILAVARETHRAHLGVVVRFVERVDAPAADRVPDLNRPVQTAGRVHFCVRSVFHARHTRLVLLRRNGADKALGGVDVVHTQHIVIGADDQVVAGWMER